MRRLLLILPLLMGVTLDGQTPQLLEPLPFSHNAHRRAFWTARIACIDCHPVGRVSDPPVKDLTAPLSTCHACHLEELPGVPHGASSQCGLCHADLAELTPADHRPGWRDGHAPAARASSAQCSDCHDSKQCFACHDDRGPMSSSPHGVGFRISHGVEARSDPQRCTTCHTGDSCTACHRTGSSPW